VIPDWQLPPGVDRGLWDYLHSDEMVRGYDEQVAASPLAATDLRFCEAIFDRPGRLIDLGCGTARLCVHFARKEFDCVGVDLSPEMLTKARENAAAAGVSVEFVAANLVDLAGLPDAAFDYATCLFSTLGMVRGAENRRAALRSAARVLKPGGRFVLHVHNRYFRGLGLKGLWSGDVTMPQAYAGAPLTLHHFSHGEAVRLLTEAGFRVTRIDPVGLGEDGRLSLPWLLPAVRAYGYLLAAVLNPARG
jgi:ubiquinone/menaquinone biosynthesis C-methylase UbiE